MTAQEIRDARTGPTLGSLNIAERSDVIDGALRRAYYLRGLEPDNGEISLAVEELEYKAAHTYPFLTGAEFRLVLEAGVSGEYGGDKRMTVANCFAWLAAYVSSEIRKGVVADTVRTMPAPAAAPPLSYHEIVQRNEDAGRNGALRLFEEVRTTGTFDVTVAGYAAMIYDYLVKRGKMNPKPETVREAFRKAKEHPKSTAYYDAGTASVRDLLDFQTKEVLLLQYFRQLAARGGALAL